MSNLDKAREWAKTYTAGKYCPGIDGPGAAAEIIKSLPKQWVDVEEVKAIIANMNEHLELGCSNDYGQGFNYSTRHWREALESLLTPNKLPTLADMTPEERLACQFMQARLEDGTLGIIVCPGDPRSCVILEDGGFFTLSNKSVTPLQGEPKLKWPGSEPQPSKVRMSEMWVDDGSSPLDAMKLLADKWEEIDRLKPEEVPDNELWLVEHGGNEFVAKRNRKHSVDYPWRIASTDGEGSDIAQDSDITLIHKLVPETPALPEGMRLADHEEFDRVVTSPRPDLNGYYAIFRLDDGLHSGSSSEYVHSIELDFLDGGE